MKRELKEFKIIHCIITRQSIARLIPMKRELKVIKYDPDVCGNLNRKAHPDEKGTESASAVVLILVM